MNRMLHSRRLALSALFTLTGASTLAAPPPPAPARNRATYGITRSRFGLAADFVIPKAKTVTLLPLASAVMQEAPAEMTLLANGMVQINATGLYRVLLGVDWKAQAGFDIDRRMIGVRRKSAGDLTAPSLSDQRLGSIDTPGADVPRVGRNAISTTVNVAPGQSAFMVVPVYAPDGGAAGMVPGDHVQVSFTNAGVVGVFGVYLAGYVTAPDVVTVSIHNAGPNTVANVSGTLNVLAQSQTLSRGESNDAWNVLNCPLEELHAGDRIYAVARVLVDGDYIQATNTTFLQIERFG